jgi:Cu2+-exporting ATPase
MRKVPVRLGTAMAMLVAACRPEADTSAGDGSSASAGAPGAATASYSPVPASTRAGDTVLATGLARATFDVKGMTCGGCVLGTRKALAKLPGVRAADASYDEKTGKGKAWAVYEPARVTPERMMAAIRQLGYAPTPSGG